MWYILIAVGLFILISLTVIQIVLDCKLIKLREKWERSRKNSKH